jgi:hypothetical protein
VPLIPPVSAWKRQTGPADTTALLISSKKVGWYTLTSAGSTAYGYSAVRANNAFTHPVGTGRSRMPRAPHADGTE